MMVLVTYDVNTQDSEGRRRLRLVAKTCVDFGKEFKTQFLSVWWIPLNSPG